MATCEDCLHFNDCLSYGKTRYYGENSACNDVQERCQYFKNKADFVEVVRCKDCVCFSYYREPVKGCNGKCEITQLLIRDDNFFCRDGVHKMAQRKEGADNGKV